MSFWSVLAILFITVTKQQEGRNTAHYIILMESEKSIVQLSLLFDPKDEEGERVLIRAKKWLIDRKGLNMYIELDESEECFKQFFAVVREIFNQFFKYPFKSFNGSDCVMCAYYMYTNY